MSPSAAVDVVLWAFLAVCGIALVLMVGYAMFGDYFRGKP